MAKIKYKVNRTPIILSYLISAAAYLRKISILSFNALKKVKNGAQSKIKYST